MAVWGPGLVGRPRGGGRPGRDLRRARLAGVGAARLGAVLEVDAVDLEGDALVTGAGLVGARLEAPGEGHGLALDQVLGGGLRLALPEDKLDVDGVAAAVA